MINVKLSKRSRELITAYTLQNYPASEGLATWLDADTFDSLLLIEWLARDVVIVAEEPNASNAYFLLASLRAELLHNLYDAMNPGADDGHSSEPVENSWTTQAQFVLLIGAGVLLAACEGFDSINTLLSMFTSLPAGMILLFGAAFSALSIVVFCGFNLVQISTNLGMKLSETPQLLDILVQQMHEIKVIRRTINNSILAEHSDKDLARLNQTLSMLKKQFAELQIASNEFHQALSGTKIQIATALFTGITGLMFLGGGFFAGQSVAVFMLSLVLTTVTPTALPVIMFSLLVGLAAFSVYWYVERVGLRKLISGWFGLDEDKIDQLCDPDILAREEKKLDAVVNKITATMRCRDSLVQKQDSEQSIQRQGSDIQQSQHSSSNRHSFYFHSANDNDGSFDPNEKVSAVGCARALTN